MIKTNAAILVEQNKPLVVDEVELPDLSYGQVLVGVRTTGICGSQLGEIEGAKGPDPWLPHLLGHEASGTVEAVGPHVTSVKPGDTVVLHWRPGGGIQAPTAKYRWRGRTLNAGWVTTFQQKTVVSENRVTPVPAGTDAETASLYGCCVTTAFGAVQNDARVRAGESVLILGTGALGLCQVIAAKLVSAHPIIAVDRFDFKLDRARDLGATHTVNAAKQQVSEEIRKILRRGACDVVLENTGARELIELGSDLTAPQGRTILVGVPRVSEKARIETLALHFGKVLKGSHGGEAKPDKDIPRLLELERRGLFSTKGLVTHRAPLERINDLIDTMRSGDCLRCQVNF